MIFWIIVSLTMMMFIEYTIHRWIQHKPKPFLYKYYKVHAIQHHGERRNDVNIDIPVIKSLGLAIVPGLFLFALGGLTAAACFAGVVTVYAMTWTKLHRSFHDVENNWTKKLWFYKVMKEHHLVHHEQPNTNFGTVFIFSDYLFGTKY